MVFTRIQTQISNNHYIILTIGKQIVHLYYLNFGQYKADGTSGL